MWTKEERAEIRKSYKFVKAGRKGSPSALLLVMDKKAELKDACPVIMCEEKGTEYTFVNPCPVCGALHIHGNRPGFRGPHCENSRYRLLKQAYPDIHKEYFVASKQEYDAMWKWAEESL